MKNRCFFHSLNEELALRLTVCYLEAPTCLRGGVLKAVVNSSYIFLITLGSGGNPGKQGDLVVPRPGSLVLFPKACRLLQQSNS